MTAASPPSQGMAVHVLGSGSGLPTAARDTTSLLVHGPDGWTLVDVPGSIVQKLALLELRPSHLRRVILTHNHVDHVYGFPHLVHALAIDGGGVLHVHAPGQTLDTVDAMVAAHGLRDTGYPEIVAHPIAMDEGFEVDSDNGLAVTASPTEHGRDTVAVRFNVAASSMCHSSDTRPSEAVAALAQDANLLFHDCAGPDRLRDEFDASHSSALQAAEVAAAAGVGSLALIHLVPDDEEVLAEMLREARSAFAGEVELAGDGAVYRLGADDG